MKMNEFVSFVRVAASVILSVAALSACKNDHCDELMFAPTNVLFYSEMDTSVSVGPALLVMRGVGTDSVMNFSSRESIQLKLDNDNERCMFACAVVTDHSLCDTLIEGETLRLVGPGLNLICPFKNESSDVLFLGDFDMVRYQREQLSDSSYLVARPEIDTLVFDYTNLVEFVSAECGCVVSHTLKNVKFLHNGIGSVVVSDSSVTNLSDAKNVKIYLENY